MVKLDDIVSLCKRRGFIYQGSEIYGGLAGTWDYGPLGVILKQNIQNVWWEHFVRSRNDMYPLDSAILMNPKVWEASGHVDTFSDLLVECENCHSIFRADQIKGDKCPTCGKEHTFGEPKPFNLMMRTYIGLTWGSFEPKDGTHLVGNIEERDKSNKKILEFSIKERQRNNSVMVYDKEGRVYLRPETAQGIFTNFKNVVDSFQPDMPFGIAQVGKAFRNEISPRDFIFRDREMEMMEIEYFINPKDDWQKTFDYWLAQQKDFLEHIGIDASKLRQFEHPDEDRSHYSQKTVDWEFEYPFGHKELTGLAYRTDFDLQAHIKHSGKNLAYQPKDGGEPFVPHVLEPTFGVERLILALLTSAYSEDEQGGERRIFLKLPEHMAPIRVAVFPLLKNKPELVKKALEVYNMLRKQFGLNVMPGPRSSSSVVAWDDNGNIGKRYRRQDEIGTPWCITIDFDTLKDNTVTLRDRDTTKQERVKITDLVGALGAGQ